MEESILLDDINVFYQTEGQGEPLVLLHGTSFSHDIWDSTIKEASKLFTVYAPDMPGFGRSDKPAALYGLPFYTDFVRKFLDALKIGQCAIAGMSMGGEVAAAFAAKYPDRVSRLVIVDAKGFSPLMKGLRTLPVLGSPLYLFMFNSRDMLRRHIEGMLYDKGILNEGLVNREWARLKDPSYRSALSRNAKYLSTADPGFPDMLKAIKARTLIIWGKEDALVPLEDAYKFKDRIPRSEVLVLERCGHVPAIEKNEELNRALLTFLAEIDLYYADDAN
jgi:pimeloyl-ACP methyl ester carboxylesterase